MQLNWMAIVAAALANMVVGFAWYSPALFAKPWMKENGMTEDDLKKSNMMKIFGFSILFSILLAVIMNPMVIHQIGVGSTVANFLESKDAAVQAAATSDLTTFMAKYGNEFRTFKHGAFHGLLYAIFLVLPIFGINGLFERRSWKYIFIHVGYWAVSLMIMGGIISAWR